MIKKKNGNFLFDLAEHWVAHDTYTGIIISQVLFSQVPQLSSTWIFISAYHFPKTYVTGLTALPAHGCMNQPRK